MLTQDLEGIGHGLIEIILILSCQLVFSLFYYEQDWHSSWLPGSTLTMYSYTKHMLICNYELKHRNQF